MKRIFGILIGLGLLVLATGCQNCFPGLRGARCRSAPAPSPLRLPHFGSAPSASAPCNTGCNNQVSSQPVYSDSGVLVDGSIVPSEGIIMDSTQSIPQMEAVPMEQQMQIRNRPIVRSSVSSSGAVPSDVIIVPGPESAPLPMN